MRNRPTDRGSLTPAAPELSTEALLVLMQAILADHPFGLLVLDRKLKPIWYNREAVVACAVWNHGEEIGMALRPDPKGFKLPQILADACATLVVRWAVGKHVPARQNIEDHARGLHACIRTIRGPIKPPPAFYIQLDYRRPRGDRERPLSPKALALYSLLSEREREVATRMREGMSTREIAAELRRSPLTIKTQMSCIFTKLGVRSRARVAALLNR